MKRAILSLLACLAAMPAGAADWVKIHTAADQSQYFYDRSKLFIHDNEITYWKKVVFKVPQFFNDRLIASGLYRERINCAEHTLKLVSYLLYTPAGEVIEYAPSKEGEAAPIIPDSLGDVFEKSVCPLVRQAQEENRIKAQAEAETKARAAKPAQPETGAASPAPSPAEAAPPEAAPAH
ncbi:MAG: hypothetical protein PHX38_01865 [Sulfuricella sp.]|nr:hypothetical protein [Sulfuricella sp.]